MFIYVYWRMSNTNKWYDISSSKEIGTLVLSCSYSQSMRHGLEEGIELKEGKQRQINDPRSRAVWCEIYI